MNSKGVKRLDQQQIASVVGDNAFKRLQHRCRGGKANFKGNRYELLFGAHRIAELIREWLSTGIDHEVEWQAGGFVDDYVVRHDETFVFRGYQLKNAQVVSWTNGDPSIHEDFALQYKLSREEGYEAIGLQLCLFQQRYSTSTQVLGPTGDIRVLHRYLLPLPRTDFSYAVRVSGPVGRFCLSIKT